jgi:hypothetical protein
LVQTCGDKADELIIYHADIIGRNGGWLPEPEPLKATLLRNSRERMLLKHPLPEEGTGTESAQAHCAETSQTDEVMKTAT